MVYWSSVVLTCRCITSNLCFWGTWVAQLVEGLPLAQVMISRSWDWALHLHAQQGICFSLSLGPSPWLCSSHDLNQRQMHNQLSHPGTLRFIFIYYLFIFRFLKNIVYAYNEYYSATKGNKILEHAIMGMNLENIMLIERSQSQRTTCYMIPLCKSSRISKSIETGSWVVVVWLKCGVAASGYWVSFWGDDHVEKLITVVAQLWEYTKNHWIVQLKWVNCTSISYRKK